MVKKLVSKFMSSNPIPFEVLNDGWKIWGISTSIGWWCKQTDEHVYKLAEHHDGQECGGRSCFASLVVAAIEEVTLWEKAGVVIKGKRWVDVGGCDGCYSIALKLLGAVSVTLLDVDPPCKWAVPVLDAVGVDIIVGDGGKKTFENVDSIALLYVPDVEFSDIFQNYPDLTQAVCSDGFFDEEFVKITGWHLHSFPQSKNYFILDEGMALPAQDREQEFEMVYWFEGDKIKNYKQVKLKLSEALKGYTQVVDDKENNSRDEIDSEPSPSVPF